METLDIIVGVIGLLATVGFFLYLAYVFRKLNKITEREPVERQERLDDRSSHVDLKKKNGRSLSEIPFIRQESSIGIVSHANIEVETEVPIRAINASHVPKNVKSSYPENADGRQCIRSSRRNNDQSISYQENGIELEEIMFQGKLKTIPSSVVRPWIPLSKRSENPFKDNLTREFEPKSAGTFKSIDFGLKNIPIVNSAELPRKDKTGNPVSKSLDVPQVLKSNERVVVNNLLHSEPIFEEAELSQADHPQIQFASSRREGRIKKKKFRPSKNYMYKKGEVDDRVWSEGKEMPFKTVNTESYASSVSESQSINMFESNKFNQMVDTLGIPKDFMTLSIQNLPVREDIEEVDEERRGDDGVYEEEDEINQREVVNSIYK